jgi:hypothetical protein
MHFWRGGEGFIHKTNQPITARVVPAASPIKDVHSSTSTGSLCLYKHSTDILYNT